ncbi:hypothetical protein ACFY3M_51605 [Streptomyces mirabilis]|uniref:hypothetical protein n=1 Tax=Streptomyces mirabilis TaxID=68239 RepID=UPI00367CCEC6
MTVLGSDSVLHGTVPFHGRRVPRPRSRPPRQFTSAEFEVEAKILAHDGEVRPRTDYLAACSNDDDGYS